MPEGVIDEPGPRAEALEAADPALRSFTGLPDGLRLAAVASSEMLATAAIPAPVRELDEATIVAAEGRTVESGSTRILVSDVDTPLLEVTLSCNLLHPDLVAVVDSGDLRGFVDVKVVLAASGYGGQIHGQATVVDVPCFECVGPERHHWWETKLSAMLGGPPEVCPPALGGCGARLVEMLVCTDPEEGSRR